MSKIEEILTPLRRRSTNRVVSDSITLVNWINESNITNRLSGDHYVVEPRDSVIEKDTGLSKKQIQNAKALLKKVGVIKFWKKTRGSNGSWRMFWNFSVYYSRLVKVVKRSSGSREFLFPYINKHGYLSWTKTFSFDTKRHLIKPKYMGILHRETRDIHAGDVSLSKNTKISKDEKPDNWMDSAMKLESEFEISF